MEITNNQLLTSLSSQKSGHVESIRGSNVRFGRMASMGITPGAKILMIRNAKRAPIIIEVRDTLVALGRSEASKILIKNDDT